MSIFTKLFSKGATDLVKEVGSVVDDLTTTKEEKLEAKRKLEDLLLNFEKNLQIELSKNIRPLTLIFLVFCTLILIFIDSGYIEFEVKQNWIDLLQIILITIIGAYFGGRSFEKIKRLNDK